MAANTFPGGISYYDAPMVGRIVPVFLAGFSSTGNPVDLLSTVWRRSTVEFNPATHQAVLYSERDLIDIMKELEDDGYWQADPQGDGSAGAGGRTEADWRAAIAGAKSAIEARAAAERAREIARKDAGLKREIEVGEIIGWRAWEVEGGFLKSMAMDTVWQPGQPVKSINPPSAFGNHEGVHALKTRALIEKSYGYTGCVIGRVALWGEVVEHETGWRGEYGSVRSLDYFCGRPSQVDDARARSIWSPGLAQLRKLYGVET